MEKLYTVSKTRPGAECGSDHELLIAKFRLKLKKVGKTTRPFRYDLNQIPYDYTVEVRNRFKGLDLIDRVPDELWNEVRDIVQETGIKTIPKKKKCQKAKWLPEEALQIAVKRWEGKTKGEKKRYTHLNAEFQWVYLSFTPLLFASLLFTAICKASSDSHFAFLHFVFLGMVLIPVSCTMSRTSVYQI